LLKGKAWTADEVCKLREFWEAGVSVSSIAERLSKTSVAVQIKSNRLGLRDDGTRRGSFSPSSVSGVELKLAESLPSIERAAGILADSMLTLARPGLKRAEVERCRAAGDAAWKYKMMMADVLRYRECERVIVELRRRVEEAEAKLAKEAKKSGEARVSAG